MKETRLHALALWFRHMIRIVTDISLAIITVKLALLTLYPDQLGTWTGLIVQSFKLITK